MSPQITNLQSTLNDIHLHTCQEISFHHSQMFIPNQSNFLNRCADGIQRQRSSLNDFQVRAGVDRDPLQARQARERARW